MRNFEKVSKVKEAFIPQRKTKKSAGYDFFAPWGGVTLNPGQSILFKTGIKCQMNDDEVLYIHIRSSLLTGQALLMLIIIIIRIMKEKS